MCSIPIRSRREKVEGSSTEQNQKFRLKASAAVTSVDGHPVGYFVMWSRRSRIPGTQPIPPSDRQIFMPGKRSGMPEKSQSTAVFIAQLPNNTASTTCGAPGDVGTNEPPDPTWRHTTV